MTKSGYKQQAPKKSRHERKAARIERTEAEERMDMLIGIARKERDQAFHKANVKYDETMKEASETRATTRKVASDAYEEARKRIYRGEAE